MLSPSSCCQQISMCTSLSLSRDGSNEKKVIKDTGTWIPGLVTLVPRLCTSACYLHKSTERLVSGFASHVTTPPLTTKVNCTGFEANLTSRSEREARVSACVPPSVVLRLMQRRRVLSRTSGGLQKQLKEPAVLMHAPPSQAFPNSHSS